MVQIDGPRSDGDIASFSYNNRRALTQVVAPDPDGSGPLAAPETNYDYDAAGRRTAVRQRYGATEVTATTVYNAAGQPTSATDPASGTVGYSYDISGRPTDTTQIVDGVARTTRPFYDISGRTLRFAPQSGPLSSRRP